MTKFYGILSLIRIRQWPKNIFIFVPTFFNMGPFTKVIFVENIMAFFAFCLASSVVYIINDISDLDSDKRHIKKCHRPLPSGLISISGAYLLLIFLVLFLAFLLLLKFNLSMFTVAISVYILLNIFYSRWLKHIPIVELVLLSSGFVIRLVAGASVVGIHLSTWIICCTASVSFMIAVGKRMADLIQENDADCLRKSLTGYNIDFLQILVGISACSTLILYIVFINTDQAIAKFGDYLLFTAVPVFYGILRYIQLLTVYKLGDSPTRLIGSDRGIYLSVIVFIGIYTILMSAKL